jgi:hypothetical protein
MRPWLFLLGLALVPQPLGAQWRVSTSRDEMTDAAVQIVSRRGDPIAARIGTVRPVLAVRCRGNELEVFTQFGFVVDRETYGRVDARLRWDAEPAQHASMSISQDGLAVFALEPETWIPRLQAGTMLRVEVPEVFGNSRIARFNLSGFRAATSDMSCVQEAVRRAAAQRSDSIRDTGIRRLAAVEDSLVTSAILSVVEYIPERVRAGDRIFLPRQASAAPERAPEALVYASSQPAVLAIESDTVVVARSTCNAMVWVIVGMNREGRMVTVLPAPPLPRLRRIPLRAANRTWVRGSESRSRSSPR